MRQRFLRACAGKSGDCTPVWFMRQAGRYMAEYRALAGATTRSWRSARRRASRQRSRGSLSTPWTWMRQSFSRISCCRWSRWGSGWSSSPATARESSGRSAPAPISIGSRPVRRGSGLCRRVHCPGPPPPGRPRPGHRIRRRAVHAGELHDRRQGLAPLRRHQEPDVERTRPDGGN